MMNQARCRLDAALVKVQHMEEYVFALEAELDIQERWTESTPEYQEFHQLNICTTYSKALDELERLVVMRLFELVKMSASGTGRSSSRSEFNADILFTGYKLRRQISKALQRRSEAIRKALERYNTQAACLNPPRPPLSWSDIVEYSFIGEFDLLRHSRDDVRDAPWTQPARREASLKFFQLCRAREELIRLNVEICRLRTWVHDEEKRVKSAISHLSSTDPLLAAELECRWILRAAMNNTHIKRLNKIESQPGFTGTRGARGMSKAGREDLVVNLGDLDAEAGNDTGAGAGNDTEAGNDTVDEDLAAFTDFVLGIQD